MGVSPPGQPYKAAPTHSLIEDSLQYMFFCSSAKMTVG